MVVLRRLNVKDDFKSQVFIITFTISSFDGVDASLLPANAASRVTETPKT
jgi:hypothetical protein